MTMKKNVDVHTPKPSAPPRRARLLAAAGLAASVCTTLVYVAISGPKLPASQGE